MGSEIVGLAPAEALFAAAEHYLRIQPPSVTSGDSSRREVEDVTEPVPEWNHRDPI